MGSLQYSFLPHFLLHPRYPLNPFSYHVTHNPNVFLLISLFSDISRFFSFYRYNYNNQFSSTARRHLPSNRRDGSNSSLLFWQCRNLRCSPHPRSNTILLKRPPAVSPSTSSQEWENSSCVEAVGFWR